MGRYDHLKEPIKKPVPRYPKGHVGDGTDLRLFAFCFIGFLIFVAAVYVLNT